MSFSIRIYRLSIESSGYGAEDITSAIARVVRESGLESGVAVVQALDRGCMATFIEYEPDLLADLESLLEKVNALSKPSVAEALIGKSVVVPVHGGSLQLGRFKSVVFIDISRVRGEKSLVIALEGVFRDR